MKLKIKDPQFNNSVAFASGMILVPAGWLAQFAILIYFSQNLALSFVYLITLPGAMLLNKKTPQLI